MPTTQHAKRVAYRLLLVLLLTGCVATDKAPIPPTEQAVEDEAKAGSTTDAATTVTNANADVNANVNKSANTGERFAIAQTGEPVEIVGILSVVDQASCKLASGCGPKYRVFSENFDDRLPLVGDINDADKDRLLRVHGIWAVLDDDDGGGTAADPQQTAVQVSRYEVLSDLNYRDFLSDGANQYTLSNFGCISLWDKSFRWKMNGDAIFLIVRLSNSIGVDVATAPYIELWYDAVTETLQSESKSNTEVNPCN